MTSDAGGGQQLWDGEFEEQRAVEVAAAKSRTDRRRVGNDRKPPVALLLCDVDHGIAEAVTAFFHGLHKG